MHKLLLNRGFLSTLMITLTITLAVPFLALADDCPELISADCDGGTAWFGLRHDDANVAQGQTVTLDCDSAINQVEFRFRVTGNPNGGVPSMVAGDEIHLALVDSDDMILVTVTTALPADIFDDWLAFTFPEGFVVPAGVYRLSAYTLVPRNCSIHFATGDNSNCYDGGHRVVSLDGIDGLWFDFGDGDIPFRLYVTPDTVANDRLVWGSIKGLFR